MPYFQNENARSGGAKYGHEEAVAIKIRAAGFTEIPRETYPKLSKSMLKKWAETSDDTKLREVTKGMPDGTFILQPAGSQGFPDVLVKDWGDRFVAVECKSGQDGRSPMWNDNLPKPNTIYVLSSGHVNETTIFMGRDVITQQLLENQQAMMDELDQVVDKYRKINSKVDAFGRGWDIKYRPQNFQGGGQTKSNYFTHKSRKTCEDNALEFAKQ
jgi:hypothetical protein